MNSYRNPRAAWLGSPNFTLNRNGHDMTQPSWVVLHTMVGTLTAANARFQQSAEQASATYGVALDGTVSQWVDEKDAAWANGASGQGGKGDNWDSISIEHEDAGDYNGPRTPELYAASADLVYDVCTRYSVPIDRAHIIGHRECDFASTACPDALDLDRIVAMAASGGTNMAQLDDVQKSVNSQWDAAFYGVDTASGKQAVIGAVNTKLDQLIGLIKAGPAVNVEALAIALAPHLQQVDVHALALDLEKVLPGADAAAVKAALAKALAG